MSQRQTYTHTLVSLHAYLSRSEVLNKCQTANYLTGNIITASVTPPLDISGERDFRCSLITKRFLKERKSTNGHNHCRSKWRQFFSLKWQFCNKASRLMSAAAMRSSPVPPPCAPLSSSPTKRNPPLPPALLSNKNAHYQNSVPFSLKLWRGTFLQDFIVRCCNHLHFFLNILRRDNIKTHYGKLWT